MDELHPDPAVARAGGRECLVMVGTLPLADGPAAGRPHGPVDGAAPPRVLHLVPTALGRGAQRFARDLADRLGGLEAGQRLVSLFDGPDDVAVDGSLGLGGGVAAATGLHPRAVGRLAGLVRRSGPDVVVAHGGDAYKYAALAGGAPLVYCVIGTWPDGPGRPAALRTAQLVAWRLLVRRARVLAPVSDDVARDCESRLGVPDRRLVVIPNGRDPERFRPAADPPEAGPPGPVRLLFVGYLGASKRPDAFVDLVGRLRAAGAPVAGAVLGDGPDRAALAGPAAAAGVSLLGASADVVPHLQRADVVVFPSAPEAEGMPGVLIEAGLCGVPVVATRVAGASTVVEDGVTGLLVPVGDDATLERAVAGLVADPARRQALGRAARARCAARFSMAVVAREWDSLLRRVVGRRS